jgi:hypothetical protein
VNQEGIGDADDVEANLDCRGICGLTGPDISSRWLRLAQARPR